MAPSRHLFRLVSFHEALFTPAYESLLQGAGTSRTGAGVEYAYGTLLEVSSAFCLGADLGFFSKTDVEALLAAHQEALSAGKVVSISADNHNRVIANNWAEQLARGYWREAVAISIFPRYPTATTALEPWFQSALLLLRSWQEKPAQTAFGALCLLGTEAQWHAAIASSSRRIMRGFFASNDSLVTAGFLADGSTDIFDGMVEMVHFLDRCREWHESLRSAADRMTDLDEELAFLLRKFAIQLVRWRAEPIDSRFRERWNEAAELGEYLVRASATRLSFDPAEAWPEGFASYAAKALNAIESMAEETPLAVPALV